MNWSNANTYCQNKGIGWRLPTLTELECMCTNKSGLPGGYEKARYWSSSPSGAYYYSCKNFDDCTTYDSISSDSRSVKCVR
jgi:hypothetical protein